MNRMSGILSELRCPKGRVIEGAYQPCIGLTYGKWASYGLYCVLTIIGLGAGCKQSNDKATQPAPPVNQAPWFKEVAQASNVNFRHVFALVQRYYLPESVSGGACLLDYDRDGLLDIYLVQGGDLEPATADVPGNRLYRNLGNWKFHDVTDATGTGDKRYGMGCTCGDYDGDGDTDIYVTNMGPNVLLRNNGDQTFTDVTTTAGVGDAGLSMSTAFVDYDGDGHLDLLVTNYVRWTPAREQVCLSRLDQRDYCGPNSYHAPAPDTLYRNQGDGTFENVSESSGLRKVYGNGLGVAVGDFNNDGHIDFYVANDQVPNQLWLNTGDGRFEDGALLAGCALNESGSAEAGMGVMAVDADDDGDLDLFMSHLRDESNTFYLNQGGTFEDATAVMGLAASSIPFTGFGLGFADFDNDRQLDIFVANGRVDLFEPVNDPDRPYTEPNLLFRGLGNRRYKEILPRGGTTESLVEMSRGAAFGDLNNDGAVDVVVVNNGAPVHILRNVVGVKRHWVMFKVLNPAGGYALGAQVKVVMGDAVLWRQVQRAYSYCSSNDPRVHFGLSDALTVDKVEVRWPDGHTQSFGPFDADTIYELRYSK